MSLVHKILILPVTVSAESVPLVDHETAGRWTRGFAHGVIPHFDQTPHFAFGRLYVQHRDSNDTLEWADERCLGHLVYFGGIEEHAARVGPCRQIESLAAYPVGAFVGTCEEANTDLVAGWRLRQPVYVFARVHYSVIFIESLSGTL